MIRKAFNAVKGDSLYLNSFFNMAGTLVTAGLGFLFWFICAHLFSAEEVGLASSLISATGFISYLSLLGFNTTFIRFLPNSTRRNAEINTGLILVFLAAIAASAAYVWLLPSFAPELSFVRDSWLFAIAFVGLSAVASINFLTDSVFVAFRSAKYNLLVYTIMGVVKLLLPLMFIGVGAFGLYTASGAAGVAGLLISLYIMWRVFGHCMQWSINKQTLKEVFSFSFGNYIVNLLNILPTLVIPFIIINQLGPTANGYYYLAFMIANLLYAIGYATTQSLFAEGSYAEKSSDQLTKRAIQILIGIMLPASVVFILIGPWMLGIFGQEYSQAASAALVILGLSAPFVGLYIVTLALLRILRKTGALVIMNIVYATLIICLAFVGAQWSGLTGVSWAWLVGHAVAGLLGLGLVWQYRRQR